VDLTRPKILAFATKGAGTNEEDRLRALLSNHPVEWFPFDRRAKFRSFKQLVAKLKTRQYDLAVMEGTGLAGGLALLYSRLLRRCRYVVSSGDAVGPWVASLHPLLGPLFTLYEKQLCNRAAGFIGWTPYLVGRALTYGTPRATTACGFALHPKPEKQLTEHRKKLRAQLGIPDTTIVFGILGSLAWNPRARFCYGAELVRAIRRTTRNDVAAVIVGDGTGLETLRHLAGPDLAKRVHLPGPVPNDQVLDTLASFDVASLPQSVDGVGSFRYTTKISEYAAARLPVVTGQIPMAYDLGGDWMWRLPGSSPWDEAYVNALAQLMETITPECLAKRRAAVPKTIEAFDRDAQVARVTRFIADILGER
jgi:glycosyltransferase involved in cell wall biosynthesis